MHSTVVQSRPSRPLSPLRRSAPLPLSPADSLYSTWQSVGSYSQDTFDTLDRAPLYSGYAATSYRPPDCELGHIFDPVTRESGDPETQLTR